MFHVFSKQLIRSIIGLTYKKLNISSLTLAQQEYTVYLFFQGHSQLLTVISLKKQNSCNYSFHEITKVTHDKLVLVIHLMLFFSPPMAGLCSMQERHSLVPNTKDCENLPANAMGKMQVDKNFRDNL